MPGTVADVGHDGVHGQLRVGRPEVVRRVEDAVLAVAEEYQVAHMAAGQLAAELAANRPPRAGDEDRLAVQVQPRVGLHLDGPAAQQVGDVDLTQPADADAAVEQLEHPGHGARFDTRTTAGIEEATHGPPFGLRHRDDDLRDVVLRDEALEVGQGPEHRHVVDALADLPGVVIDEADRLHTELWVLVHLAHDERTRVARARDQDASDRCSRPVAVQDRGGLAQQPDGETDPRDAGKGEQPVDGQDRAREERNGLGNHRHCHGEGPERAGRRDGQDHHL